MVKVAVDLHIHSCLSPCADMDMTPNNIVNMACLKGLDFIAVTDHNTVENLSAVIQCAKEQGIIVIPGMELETQEEIHVLCYFKSLEMAIEFQNLVYNSLPEIKNRSDIFGRQVIMNEKDDVVGEKEQMLLTATNISLDELVSKIKDYDGVIVPAHVDRESYSLLASLGMIPDDYGLRFLELSKRITIDQFVEKNPLLNKYSFLKSSDAHYLWDISERTFFLELEDKKLDSFFSLFEDKKVR